MSRTIPLSEAKAHLSELVKDVHETHEIITISKGGVPATVLMSVDEYESLIETLEILSDPEIMEAIRIGLEDEKQGKLISFEEVLRDLQD
ncbi:MAG TPA: type II toxin-antitoxin system Phd/YefM family antitoxin [Nitrospirota bacterium]|jgi:prevent-host-death family protein